MELSVIIVNYNNLRVLKGCLRSLMPRLKGVDAEVLLSDNGSTDGSLMWVLQSFPEVNILENGANLGFAEANNRAFAAARGRYLLMLNPDTVVADDAIGRMLAFMGNNEQIGALGCKMIDSDGTRQISARSFPTLLTYWLGFSGLAWRYPSSRFCGRFHLTYWNGETARCVDWVCGAVLMFRRKVLDRVKGLDPYFFLTYDEVDFCHRIKKAGYEVWYTPEASIVHLEGQSEPQSNIEPEGRLKYMTVERNSRVRYFVKNRGYFYAVLVEMLHLLMNTLLLIKAKLVGTHRSPLDLMEKKLFIRLYWRTVRRIPQALQKARHTSTPADDSPRRFKLFMNPYLTDDA